MKGITNTNAYGDIAVASPMANGAKIMFLIRVKWGAMTSLVGVFSKFSLEDPALP